MTPTSHTLGSPANPGRVTLEGETKWEEALANSQDQLAALADAALTEHGAGKTRPLDPDTL